MKKVFFDILIGAVLVGLVIIPTIFFIDHLMLSVTLHIPRNVKDFFDIITDFGQSAFYLILFSFVALLAFLLHRWRGYSFARELAVFYSFVFVNIATCGIVVNILKFLFVRARPKLWLNHQVDGFFLYEHLATASRRELSSFPSGHSATATALFISLIYLLQPRWRPWGLLTLIPAFLIVGSRVIINVHYVSDTIAGIFIALACCYAWRHFYLQKFSEFPKPLWNRFF